jgi:hypothetical protein
MSHRVHERVILDRGLVHDAPDARLAKHDAAVGVEGDEITSVEARPAEIGHIHDRQLACPGLPRAACSRWRAMAMPAGELLVDQAGKLIWIN